MRRTDPHPDQEMLSLPQTARLVGLSPADFREFLKEPGNSFPRSFKRLGKTKNKRPRLMWFKAQVLTWIDFQEMQHEQNEAENS